MKAALTLTTAQIEALPNAPLQVIAAPGVGKAIAVLGIQYAFNLIAGYTLSDSSPITDSSDIATTYGANVLNAIPATLGSFLSSATPRLYVLQGSDASVTYAAVDNQPIYIASDSENGLDFIGGDPANSLGVTIEYEIIDL